MRTWAGAFAAMLFVLSCTHAAPNGMQPDVRPVVHGDREIEVDAAIHDVASLVDALSRQDMVLHAVWMVPGEPGLRVAGVSRPPEETAYGPQLVAIDVRGDVRILHESPRLLDDDFLYPTFFTFARSSSPTTEAKTPTARWPGRSRTAAFAISVSSKSPSRKVTGSSQAAPPPRHASI